MNSILDRIYYAASDPTSTPADGYRLSDLFDANATDAACAELNQATDDLERAVALDDMGKAYFIQGFRMGFALAQEVAPGGGEKIGGADGRKNPQTKDNRLIVLRKPASDRCWLAEIRGKRSQYEAAREIGIPQSTYAMIECGARKPSVPMAKKIAAALGFEWTKFFEEKV